MAEKDDLLRTVEPKSNIPCRTCKHKLQPVEIMGEKIHRYTYGSCHAFENKPQGVIWGGEKCELYEKE